MKKWIPIEILPEDGLYVAAHFEGPKLVEYDTNYYFLKSLGNLESNGIFGGLKKVTHYMSYKDYKEFLFEALSTLPKD